MIRTVATLAVMAAGATFAYCGFLALDIAPGIPLGLGMMFIGAAHVLFAPLIALMDRR
jgi:hypothetical protein